MQNGYLPKVSKFNIFSKFHAGYTRNVPVTSITIHGSAGGNNAQALFNWWDSLPTLTDKWSVGKTERMKRAIGFYHYLIDLDGTCFQMLDEFRWAYHSHSGRMDAGTIAVCLVNTRRENSGSYTDEQYHTLHELITDITTRRPQAKTIYSHQLRADLYSNLKPPQVTPCPGPEFEWGRLKIFGLSISK